MRKFTVILMAGVAIASTPAMAQQQNIPAEDEAAEDEIVVFGQGETRQVQELTSKELLILAPGTSPLNEPRPSRLDSSETGAESETCATPRHLE